MLQQLLENPQRLFGLVLTPTRELAFQISEQVEALGIKIILHYLLYKLSSFLCLIRL